MKEIYYNAHLVLDGNHSISNGYMIIDSRKIVEIGENKVFDQGLDMKGKIITPGFIDIHMHGALGEDCITGSQMAVDAMSKSCVKDGCTSFITSLTVLSHEETLSVLDSFSTCYQPQHANWLGIHMEGPYLSCEYKALMDERYLRDPNIQELDEMIEHSNNNIKIMTIAPERKGMNAFIQYATNKGIACMIGHTNCTSQQAKSALDYGAIGFTHLYNAMSGHVHRRAGCVTQALLHDQAFAELICDGFHVEPEVIQATYKIVGKDRIVLITDAMLGKGMEDGDYVFSNLLCHKEGIQVRVKETGRIAGSAIGMIDGIHTMQKVCNVSANDIVQMACINPSKVAKVDHRKGTLTVGKDADFTVLDSSWNVESTYVSGKCVYRK